MHKDTRDRKVFLDLQASETIIVKKRKGYDFWILKGLPGNQGEQGVAGIKGDPGKDGEDGKKGDIGLTGQQVSGIFQRSWKLYLTTFYQGCDRSTRSSRSTRKNRTRRKGGNARSEVQ